MSTRGDEYARFGENLRGVRKADPRPVVDQRTIDFFFRVASGSVTESTIGFRSRIFFGA